MGIAQDEESSAFAVTANERKQLRERFLSLARHAKRSATRCRFQHQSDQARGRQAAYRCAQN